MSSDVDAVIALKQEISSHGDGSVTKDKKESSQKPANPKSVASKPSTLRSKTRKKGSAFPSMERKNWLIHLHYIRKDYSTCLSLIDEQTKESKNRCEYPLYVKGMILRREGDIQESLKLFQQCHQINSKNADNMKQIGKNLTLLGRHKSAIECYNRALEMSGKDWEISHSLAVCYQFLKQYDTAEKLFNEALSLSRHVITYQMLSKLHMKYGESDKAKQILIKGVEYYGENVELLTSLGLLYLQDDEFHKAFEFLGKSLTYDPQNYKAILAAGSLMQQHGDFDVALSKYRSVAHHSSESSSLWNNIAMCFYGKKKNVAAICCLKRANYLSPFDWRILYNLSLLHLSMQQYASSFHFSSTAITLNRDQGGLYMLLAISLTYLGQINNAEQAFQQALHLENDDEYLIVNFASFLHHVISDSQQASSILAKLKKLKKTKDIEKEVTDAGKKLMISLNVGDDMAATVKKRKSDEKKREKKKDSAQRKNEQLKTEIPPSESL